MPGGILETGSARIESAYPGLYLLTSDAARLLLEISREGKNRSTSMARLSGIAGMRPMSALAVVVGIGMLLTFGTFFYSPLAGVGGFFLLWVITSSCCG